MTIWKRLMAGLVPRDETQSAAGEPFFVQDGGLRAYIWPGKQQFSFEVVNTLGQKLFVGTDQTLERVRNRAIDMLRRLR